MDDRIYISGILLLVIWFSYSLIKTGIKAMRGREKPIGPMDLRMALPAGIVGLAFFVFALVKVVIIPLIEGK